MNKQIQSSGKSSSATATPTPVPFSKGGAVPSTNSNSKHGTLTVPGKSVYGVAVVGAQRGRDTVTALNYPIACRGTRLRISNVKVFALCEHNQPLAEAAQREFPHLHITDSFADVVSHPRIDIVVLQEPDPARRFNQLLVALKQGKHVLLEHPLVATLGEARLLSSLLQGTALTARLRCVQASQVFPSFIYQHRQVKAGVLGELQLLEATYVECRSRSDDPALDTPDIRKLRSYSALANVVTLLRCFFKNITTVSAYGRCSSELPSHAATPSDEVQVLDTFVVNVRTLSGQVATLTVLASEDRIDPECTMKCSLFGTQGTSVAEYPSMKYTEFTTQLLCRKMLDLHNQDYYFNRERLRQHPYGCISNYLYHFASSLPKPGSLKTSMAQGIQTFLIIEAIYQSASTGEVVKIKDLKKDRGDN